MDKNKLSGYQKELLSRLVRDRTDVFGYFIRERQAVLSETMAQLHGVPTAVEDFAEWMVADGRVGTDSVEAWRELFAAADRGAKKGSAMLTLRGPGGNFGRFWLRFNMIEDEDGRPFFAVVSFDDFTPITQQIRARENDINGLLQATQRVFPEILTLNITQGTYRIIQYDGATSLGTARTGNVEDMIRIRLGGVEPEDRERFVAAFSIDRLREVFSENAEESVQLVYRRLGRDGKACWTETTVMRQENAADSDILLVAMSRNVDQQKAEELRLREAMRQQAEELRLTMSQMGKIINYYDIPARTLTMPPAQAKKYGMPSVMADFPESFVAQAPPGYPQEALATIQKLYDTIRGGEPAGSYEYRALNAEGKEVWMRMEFVTIFDDQNRPVRAVVGSENITKGYAQAMENRQLKENEYLLRLTTKHSDRAICHYDLKKERARRWDPKTCEKCQLPHLCEMSPKDILACGDILPESVEELRAMFRDIHNGKPEGAIKMRVRVPSGERRWFDLQYSTIFDSEGAPISAMISHKDITEQYEHELAFRRYEQATEFDEAGNMLFVEADLTTDWIEKIGGEMLPAEERRVQSAFSDFMQRMLEDKIPHENREDAARYFSREALLEQYARDVRRLNSEWHVRFRDGTLHWMGVEIQLMADPYTGNVKAFIRMADITDERQAREAIRQRSERDGMTGLYNRATAEERVRALMEAKEYPGLLILLDLDDLKGINDTFGHKEGDRALLGIAETLKNYFRDSDIVARIGGDEFFVYLPGAAEKKDVIASSLSYLLRRLASITIGPDDEYRIHCSIGCAEQTPETETYEALFRQADTALYHVKRNGKNNFAFYEPAMVQEDYQFRAQKLLSQQGAKKIEARELQYLLGAIASFYPLVLSINLSTNDYFLMEETEGVLSHAPTFGTLDGFVRLVAEIMHPDDAADYYERLSRKALLAAYERGEKSIRHYCRILKNGEYRWAEVQAIFYTNESGDVCDFTLLRWAAERAYELDQMWMRKALELAAVSNFEYVCLLNLSNGEYSLFGDEKNTHDVPLKGSFDSMTRMIRDRSVAPEEREAYFEKARLDRIRERMKEGDGTYAYSYTTPDGRRRASFHWFEPTHTQVLMIVQRTG